MILPNATMEQQPCVSINMSDFVNVSSFIRRGHDPIEVLQDPNTIIRLVLCFLALAANVLSIAAVASIPRKMTPHLKLIISLAASDSLVPISILIHIVNAMYNLPSLPYVHTHRERLVSACIHQTVNSLNVTAHLISLFNLFCLAVDHYIAIMKPLHYIRVTSRKRTTLVILTAWGLAFLGGFSNFFNGFMNTIWNGTYSLNFCERTFHGDYEAEYLVIAVALVCFGIILYIYCEICCLVKNLDNLFKMRGAAGEQIHKNKKSLYTTGLIIGSFVVCWLPHMIFQIIMLIAVHTDAQSVRRLLLVYLEINDCIYTLLVVNSIIDPIIYAVRLKEVQLGYVRLVAHCSKTYREKLAAMKYQRSPHFMGSRKVSSQTISCEADWNELSPLTHVSTVEGMSDKNVEVLSTEQC